jgi:large subunit ribosomal protein L19
MATKKTEKTKTTAKKTMKTKGPASIMDTLKSASLKTDLPEFKTGDKIIVNAKIKEGDKERVQAFEGIVIARNGSGIREAITVRKVSAGVGVERVFPIHSPAVSSIEVKVEGFVRRSKLYYLRDLSGRAARIQDKSIKLSEARGRGDAADSAKS